MQEHMSMHNVQNGQFASPTIPYEHAHAAEFGNGSQSGLIPVPSGAETDDKRKRGSAASATNDKELRELLSHNEARNLKDVAAEVIATERTSRAEKTKQLFAMLW